jgi:hypothetical protein
LARGVPSGDNGASKAGALQDIAQNLADPRTEAALKGVLPARLRKAV